MSAAKHTPGPLDVIEGRSLLHIETAITAPVPGVAVCSLPKTPEGRAWAARIVQCVNAHDKLVAAGKELLEAFDNTERSAHERACYLQLAVASIRDAIAKATGGAP